MEMIFIFIALGIIFGSSIGLYNNYSKPIPPANFSWAQNNDFLLLKIYLGATMFWVLSLPVISFMNDDIRGIHLIILFISSAVSTLLPIVIQNIFLITSVITVPFLFSLIFNGFSGFSITTLDIVLIVLCVVVGFIYWKIKYDAEDYENELLNWMYERDYIPPHSPAHVDFFDDQQEQINRSTALDKFLESLSKEDSEEYSIRSSESETKWKRPSYILTINFLILFIIIVRFFF